MSKFQTDTIESLYNHLVVLRDELATSSKTMSKLEKEGTDAMCDYEELKNQEIELMDEQEKADSKIKRNAPLREAIYRNKYAVERRKREDYKSLIRTEKDFAKSLEMRIMATQTMIRLQEYNDSNGRTKVIRPIYTCPDCEGIELTSLPNNKASCPECNRDFEIGVI